VTLACAMPKKSKFETIIEKATELGVDEIIPLATKRTEVILKGERAARKRQRFESVATNAAKQSRRSTIPRIHDITEFRACIDALPKDALLIMPGLIEPRIDIARLFPLKEKEARLTVLIGPEGDFTPQEYAYAQQKGARIVSLGPTTLKVETAALAAVAFMMLHQQI
jgi:16S rRNA (uracil1498-N3)-methyltransferase